jgi:hypothetical protein
LLLAHDKLPRLSPGGLPADTVGRWGTWEKFLHRTLQSPGNCRERCSRDALSLTPFDPAPPLATLEPGPDGRLFLRQIQELRRFLTLVGSITVKL